MTREQQRQLKEIDEQIVKAGYVLQTFILERAKIDPWGTRDLIKGISDVMQRAVKKPAVKK